MDNQRALDDVGAKTTVVSFDSRIDGLFSRDEEVKANEFPIWKDLGSDTRPSTSFNMARRVLSASPMPNKLFICLTDGEWNSYDTETNRHVDLEEVIASIPARKIYVGIGDGSRTNTRPLNEVI